MDSNVSKTTFSHKFFKLRFNRQNNLISFKDLLKQNLLSALDLYQQKNDLSWTKCPRARLNQDKIVILQSFNFNHGVLLSSPGLSIVYSSSLALFLASQIQQSPQIVAKELVDFLIFQDNNSSFESDAKLLVTTTKSAWLNFCLDSTILATWLELTWLWLKTKSVNQVQTEQLATLADTPQNIFSIQYLHARCCSLLRLAAREKLVVLKENQDCVLKLSSPQSISWLNESQILWLKMPPAWNLLHQLLLVADLYSSTASVNWVKVGCNLSQAVAVFEAACPFVASIRDNNPELAMARVGLLAITQAWLQIILTENLKVIAPVSL